MILPEKTNLLQYQPKHLEWRYTFQKLFFKFNHFTLFEIKNKWFSSYKNQNQGTGSRLTSKGLVKLFLRIQKLYQIPYLLCNPLWSLFVQSSDTNLLVPRGTLGLQCICRAQLFIQMTHLHCRLPCNYIKILLAYCRGQKRITTYIYCIKLQLRYF